MEPKGAGFLKVTGIIMIIGGVISFILSIIALLFVAALDAATAGAYVTSLLYASAFLGFGGSIAEFIAGIVGVVNSKKPEKAQTCVVWGTIVAVICVVSNILTVAGGNDFDMFSLLLGLVLPALYIFGAIKNKG